jgi:hypothetical protein
MTSITVGTLNAIRVLSLQLVPGSCDAEQADFGVHRPAPYGNPWADGCFPAQSFRENGRFTISPLQIHSTLLPRKGKFLLCRILTSVVPTALAK